jgi:hypothetical protein
LTGMMEEALFLMQKLKELSTGIRPQAKYFFNTQLVVIIIF